MTPLADQLAQIIKENVSSRDERLRVVIAMLERLDMDPKLGEWYGSVNCLHIVVRGMEIKDG